MEQLALPLVLLEIQKVQTDGLESVPKTVLLNL
jgi:hypothetical protein